jgi:hypothetical protein
MPPHRPKPDRPMDHPPKQHHAAPAPPTAIRALLSADQLEPLLVPFIPDAADRAFVTRCILEQGPIHHRGASFALLSLLSVLLERTGGVPDKPVSGEAIAVPLRLPPHLAPEHDEDNAYPLRMPLAPLELIAPKGTLAFHAFADCLLDGPPHHALANAAMVCALGALLERFPARSSEGEP